MTNRYICDVLEAMRKCYETRNFSYLPGLIEEAQLLADRMEAGLGDKADVRYYGKKVSALKEEIRTGVALAEEAGIELSEDLQERLGRFYTVA